MNKVITSVNALLAPEGIRVAYTYSEMDDEGEILSRRNQGYFIATGEAELEAVDTLKLAAARRLGAVADNDPAAGSTGADTAGGTPAGQNGGDSL